MNIYRFLDVHGQKMMWRYPDAPVESTPGDLVRLAELADRSPAADELHPEVEAPTLTARETVELERSGAVCYYRLRPAAASADPCGLQNRSARVGPRTPTVRFSSTPAQPACQAVPLEAGLMTSRPLILEDRFAFPSPCPTGKAAVDTVHVLRWRPSGRGPADTALVMAHGAFARDHARIHWFVPPVARAPWDTFSVELPHHMRRQRPDSAKDGTFFVSADVPRLVRAMHQSETDLRALVKGLRAAGYRRIVLGGISISGNVVFESVLREPVDGAFALVPSMDAYASLWESVLGQKIRPLGNAAGFADGTVRRALRLITPAFMGRPVVPPERLLLIYGENDLLCPPAPVRRLMKAWGVSNERVLETGHATVPLRFRTIRRTVAAWMRAVTGLGHPPARLPPRGHARADRRA